MKPDHDAWARRGYAVVRRMLAGTPCSFLYDYALKSSRCGKLRPGDSDLPATPCAYADPLMESLLEALRPRVEAATGLRLCPTYSYLRVYKRGDVLARHTDRPACEVSATLCLGYSAARPWPIWLAAAGGERPVDLRRGDALLYKGAELPHWREALAGEHSAQVFLHYVDRDGPHRDWAYDKRAGLAASAEQRRSLAPWVRP